MFTLLFIIWTIFGFTRLRDSAIWLERLADPVHVKHTWMVWPSALLMMIAWPINHFVGRLCYIFTLSFNSK